MKMSQSYKPHKAVEYYPLPNGFADEFMHRNETIGIDTEGQRYYVAEVLQFQITQEVTKQQIESDFDYWWEDAGKTNIEPSLDDVVESLKQENESLKSQIDVIALEILTLRGI